MYYKTRYTSPLGIIALASDGGSLNGLWFEGQKYFQKTLSEKPVYREDLPVFRDAADWLDRYFSGQKPLPAELPLAPMGSEFRQKVWDILCEIPYGSITTYGAIAERLAAENGRSHMSAQAVGGAVGHNPLSILIPCHRVVGANGSLTGYAGGVEKKRRLLELEGVDISRFPIPKTGTAL